MNNQAVIVFLLLLSAIIFYSSRRLFYKGNYSYAIGCLIVGGLILRMLLIADPYLHEWDERYHALVAKNIIDNPFIPYLYKNPILEYDYQNWSLNHIWVHKQPVPLWTMGLSLSVFGINELSVRLPSLFLSTLGIFLIFKIGCYLFDREVGFVAAFLFAIQGLLIELTGGRVATDHIDVFFCVLILWSVHTSILFVQSKKVVFNLLTGVLIGGAILSKWLPALIIFPIWLLLVIQSRKFVVKEILGQLLLLTLMTIVIALPWQIYIHQVFPLETAWESAYNFKHIFEDLLGNDKPIYYHFEQLKINYGELIYIPCIWFIFKTLKRPKQYKRLILLIWFLVPYAFFSLTKTKMQAYTLFSAPAVLLISAVFWKYIKVYKARFRYKWLAHLLLIGLIVLPIRFSLERIKPFQVREKPEWRMKIESYEQLDNSNTIFFNCQRPIEMMFYLDCIAAYAVVPSKEKIRELEMQGYRIVIE